MENSKRIESAYKSLAAAVITKAIKDSIKKDYDSYNRSANYFLENIKDTIFWNILNNGQFEAKRIEYFTGIHIKL